MRLTHHHVLSAPEVPDSPCHQRPQQHHLHHHIAHATVARSVQPAPALHRQYPVPRVLPPPPSIAPPAVACAGVATRWCRRPGKPRYATRIQSGNGATGGTPPGRSPAAGRPLVAVADHPPDHMRAGTLMGLHQLRKRRLRAVDDGPHQGLVRIQRCSGCRRRRCIVAATAPQCRQRFAEQAHARGASCARGMSWLSPCVRQDG